MRQFSEKNVCVQYILNKSKFSTHTFQNEKFHNFITNVRGKS